ncbi:helix-turn-helix domain-containing protein [Gordonia sp. CPCC 206044]|uniref:helix-turn-helix domain-containing protein n=1 Tax=Gordonia sp. CPCC 206044 TaxID=3140793 RepID=UPI003AF3A007
MTETVGDAAAAGQSPRSPSPPTARVVAIMDLLTRPDIDTMTLAEIVRHTRLSRATAHAIVAELSDRGWVLRDQDGGIRIGPGFVALARRTREIDHLAEWGSAALREVTTTFGIAGFVARRTSDDTITVTDQVGEVDGSSRWLAPGHQLRLTPPICREFVAWEPEVIRSQWVAQASAATRTRLDLVLEAIRRRGYSIERMTDEHLALIETLTAIDTMPDRLRSQATDLLTELTVIDYLDSELTDEIPVVTLGAPIFDADARVIASLVICPRQTMPVDQVHRLGNAALRAAAVVSTRLGHHEAMPDRRRG